LTESNLLVDEEQNLCLQQLIPDPTKSGTSLKDLGELWHKLLDNSGKNFEGFLDSLLDKMVKGEIETTTQLRSQLQGFLQKANLESLESSDENAIRDVLQSEDAEDVSTALNRNDEEAEDPEEDAEQTIVARSPDDLPTLMLPVQILSLSDAACSDIGRQRTQNEDYFGIQTQTHKQQNPQGTKYKARGLYIICDGMGGHSAGEVASAMGVQLLQRYFKTNWRDALPDRKAIREGIIQTNNSIYKVNCEKGKSGNKRMGTTLILALVEDTKVAIAHVGDSRIYGITRRFGLQRLTRDHCVAQMEIKRGVPAETAYARPDAYQLTQALGPRDGHLVEPDISFFDIKEDTILLLCSDGLYDNEFVENHWQSHIAPLLSGQEDLEQGVIKLVGLANQYNGHDNITGVLVRIKTQPDLNKKSQ
jgi:protein phosphatase